VLAEFSAAAPIQTESRSTERCSSLLHGFPLPCRWRARPPQCRSQPSPVFPKEKRTLLGKTESLPDFLPSFAALTRTDADAPPRRGCPQSNRGHRPPKPLHFYYKILQTNTWHSVKTCTQPPALPGGRPKSRRLSRTRERYRGPGQGPSTTGLWSTFNPFTVPTIARKGCLARRLDAFLFARSQLIRTFAQKGVIGFTSPACLLSLRMASSCSSPSETPRLNNCATTPWANMRRMRHHRVDHYEFRDASKWARHGPSLQTSTESRIMLASDQRMKEERPAGTDSVRSKRGRPAVSPPLNCPPLSPA